MTAPPFDTADKIRSVVTVARGGDHGRGFLMHTHGNDTRYYVITAAHCLPRLPPAHPASYTAERTYEALVGPLGTDAPALWAECAFVDPVADIAVLSGPDDQALPEQHDAWMEYMEPPDPDDPETLFVERGFQGRGARPEERCWLLSSEGDHWFLAKLACDRRIWIEEAAEPLRGGMSGSPILADDGYVLGVFSIGGGTADSGEDQREGGPNPQLYACLPRWMPDALWIFPPPKTRKRS